VALWQLTAKHCPIVVCMVLSCIICGVLNPRTRQGKTSLLGPCAYMPRALGYASLNNGTPWLDLAIGCFMNLLCILYCGSSLM